MSGILHLRYGWDPRTKVIACAARVMCAKEFVIDAISETLLNVPEDEHENAFQYLEKNELEYETREDDLANLQQVFDARMAEAESKSKLTEISNIKIKPKF